MVKIKTLASNLRMTSNGMLPTKTDLYTVRYFITIVRFPSPKTILGYNADHQPP